MVRLRTWRGVARSSQTLPSFCEWVLGGLSEMISTQMLRHAPYSDSTTLSALWVAALTKAGRPRHPLSSTRCCVGELEAGAVRALASPSRYTWDELSTRGAINESEGRMLQRKQAAIHKLRTYRCRSRLRRIRSDSSHLHTNTHK